MKKYVLIAGVNGAGKSTLYQLLENISELPRVNTDEIVREFGKWDNPMDVAKAGKIAVRKLRNISSKTYPLIKKLHYVEIVLLEIFIMLKSMIIILNCIMYVWIL